MGKFSNGNSLVSTSRYETQIFDEDLSCYEPNRTKTGGRGERQQREREEPEAGEEKKSRRRTADHEATEKRNFRAREEPEEAREQRERENENALPQRRL